MKLGMKFLDSPRGRAALALAVNLLFLAGLMVLYEPWYDTSDDRWISSFVDGQRSVKTAYIPFVNIGLGVVLKLLYSMGGDGINQYGLLSYAVIFAGLTAVSWCGICRFRPCLGLCLSLLLLVGFGMGAYLRLNFTKTSAIAGAGGLSLMLYCREYLPGKRAPLVLGGALALVGAMYRMEIFLCTGALLASVGLARCCRILREGRPFKAALDYARPFILLLAAVGMLYGADRVAWGMSEDYAAYQDFNVIRHRFLDYGVPKYEAMPQVYDSLGLNESAAKLIGDWNIEDPDKMDGETLASLAQARDQEQGRLDLKGCLRVLIEECLGEFFKSRAFLSLLAIFLMWAAAGRRDLGGWLGALWAGLVSLALYCYLIYDRRPLLDRVDMGLFLALGLSMLWGLDGEKLRADRLLILAIAALGLLINARTLQQTQPYIPSAQPMYQQQRSSAERILEEDALFLYKVLAIPDPMYGPLETYPQGFMDKLQPLGSWAVRHPATVELLAGYGIVNCYRDLVDNQRAYLIDQDIETTLAYIRSYYAPDARAELVEPLSTETGLSIYRILSY